MKTLTPHDRPCSRCKEDGLEEECVESYKVGQELAAAAKVSESAVERLEYLSDQVRRGISVGFGEALEVIEYQSALKLKNKRSAWRKIVDWIRA